MKQYVIDRKNNELTVIRDCEEIIQKLNYLAFSLFNSKLIIYTAQGKIIFNINKCDKLYINKKIVTNF